MPLAGQPLTVQTGGRTYYIPGARIMLKCDAGYNLSASALAVCGEDGHWIPPLATCFIREG